MQIEQQPSYIHFLNFNTRKRNNTIKRFLRLKYDPSTALAAGSRLIISMMDNVICDSKAGCVRKRS